MIAFLRTIPGPILVLLVFVVYLGLLHASVRFDEWMTGRRRQKERRPNDERVEKARSE